VDNRLLLALLLLLSIPNKTYACSCSMLGPAPCAGLSESGVLFVGTVFAIDNPPQDDGGLGGPGESRYRFRVDENFVGAQEPVIDIYSGRGGADCSFHFRQGGQYLVSPYKNRDGRLVATICSITRPVETAHALLPQLRAMRDHQRVASLYGVVRSGEEPYGSVTDNILGRPLVNTRILLRSSERTFAAMTDSNGAYAFYDAPVGQYQIEAELSSNLEIAQTILDDPPPPLQLPAAACYEYDVDALPTGSIQGRVLGPDGRPLAYASVELYRPEKYPPNMPTLIWMESQQKAKTGYFQFNHVGPGDYIIVYNRRGQVTPDKPFPRTFYPGVSNEAKAGRVHVGAGEKVAGSDINLGQAKPTRPLKIHLVTETGKLPNIKYVEVRGSDGFSPGEVEVSPAVYEFSLFKDVRYTIHGEGYCSATNKKSRTDSVEVDGSDDRQSEITLTFKEPGCGN
jgi:hypothetical protein